MNLRYTKGNLNMILNNAKLFNQRLGDLMENTLDPALKRRAGWIIKNLDPEKGDIILDVGCGDGYYLYLLSNLGLKLRLAGVDSDKKALISAKRNLVGKNITLVHGDLMTKLPFKNGLFDKVVMSEVLEHLPDDAKGLKEVKRILKPNGIIVISVPNANYPFLWDPINWTLEHIFHTHFKSGFWAGIWNQHERLYKTSDLEKVLKFVGFKIIKIQSLTRWSLPFNHYLINIGARILAGSKNSTAIGGANKFSDSKNRTLLPRLYSNTSTFIDKFNVNPHNKAGVSIVIKLVNFH